MLYIARWLILGLLLLTFQTCQTSQGKLVYKKSYEIADASLSREVLRFEVTVQDITKPYDIYLTFISTPHYPYQNFFVNYTLNSPQNQVVEEKLCNYYIFEPKTGKPLGKGWRKNKAHKYPLLKNHLFLEKGTYTLSLQQFMRLDPLPGIVLIGTEVYQAQTSSAKKE